jgi:hypothetical protein
MHPIEIVVLKNLISSGWIHQPCLLCYSWAKARVWGKNVVTHTPGLGVVWDSRYGVTDLLLVAGSWSYIIKEDSDSRADSVVVIYVLLTWVNMAGLLVQFWAGVLFFFIHDYSGLIKIIVNTYKCFHGSHRAFKPEKMVIWKFVSN